MIVFRRSSFVISESVRCPKPRTRNMSGDIPAGTFSVAYVTVDNMTTAHTLAKGMLDKHLAAAINMIPGVQSMFRYKGIERTANEVFMIIKTRTSKVEELCDFVKSNHPYECPQVITTQIEQGNPAYLKWIGENVPEN